MRLSKHLSLLVDLVFPRSCVACGVTVDRLRGHLCWNCRTGLPMITEAFCDHCGDPIEGEVDHTFRCSGCRILNPRFDQARSAVRYRGAVAEALRQFKYGRRVSLAADLGEFIVACVNVHFSVEAIDQVAAVPLHPTRERSRTFNQARLLAGHVAARIGKPLLPGRCLVRVKRTPTQTRLNARERRRSIQDAFRVRESGWIAGRAVLLVDDVMTTGATVAEASRMLKQAGATAVYVATVARG